METRKLGNQQVSTMGLGCMGLSHAYGTPPARDHAKRVLNEALDLGYTHLDTAALYGFGHNEELLGEAVSHRRSEFYLASKAGIFKDADGKRSINGHPDTLRATCEGALKRLNTDFIDLYYLHRMDRNVPIEDSIGELARLKDEGKIGAIGLSEVGSVEIKRAHAVHPITALQTEYSLWTRNPEISVLETCKELGITFVGFGSVGRGFLSGKNPQPENFVKGDLRAGMPRFNDVNYPKNVALLSVIEKIAAEKEATMAQVALAWVCHKGDHVISIPGTTNLSHLEENINTTKISLSENDMRALEEVFTPEAIAGPRYNAVAQADVYTENFS